jgi:hypothetical protein
MKQRPDSRPSFLLFVEVAVLERLSPPKRLIDDFGGGTGKKVTP